jgi:hypothetical protein
MLLVISRLLKNYFQAFGRHSRDPFSVALRRMKNGNPIFSIFFWIPAPCLPPAGTSFAGMTIFFVRIDFFNWLLVIELVME